MMRSGRSAAAPSSGVTSAGARAGALGANGATGGTDAESGVDRGWCWAREDLVTGFTLPDKAARTRLWGQGRALLLERVADCATAWQSQPPIPLRVVACARGALNVDEHGCVGT